MHATAPSPSRPDVYQSVTNAIVAAIEAGAGPFTMPWHGTGASLGKPHNAVTQMEYHGINVLALWAAAQAQQFQSGLWASYRQWQSVGTQVIKGAIGSTIVFFKRVQPAEQASEENAPQRLIARASRVFNADQVVGWKAPDPEHPVGDAELIDSVETFIAGTGATVRTSPAGRRACYHIGADYIEMPDRRHFVGSLTSTATEAYSATLLHELVHWSGAVHRLNRDFAAATSKADIAAEELVAEIGAAFLCADLGVSNEPRPDHAAYVSSWLRLLRNDTRAIFAASRLANQAAMYLNEMSAGNG